MEGLLPVPERQSQGRDPGSPVTLGICWCDLGQTQEQQAGLVATPTFYPDLKCSQALPAAATLRPACPLGRLLGSTRTKPSAPPAAPPPGETFLFFAVNFKGNRLIIY